MADSQDMRSLYLRLEPGGFELECSGDGTVGCEQGRMGNTREIAAGRRWP